MGWRWGAFNASEEFTGSRVLGLGGGRRLPGGLRGSCHGLPLVGRADAGKKPGGDRLRALACTDRTGRAPNGRGSRSPRTGVAGRVETVPHRSGPPSPVASEQPTSGTIGAAESTDPAPAAAKKPHTKRKTVRHERPSREFLNPMNFFAWGSANGARRAF